MKLSSSLYSSTATRPLRLSRCPVVQLFVCVCSNIDVCVLLCWVWAMAEKCSALTWHFVEMTWENTQITAWCLNRESIYTRWHGTHAGGSSLYRGTIVYGLCPHVDWEAWLPGFKAVVAILMRCFVRSNVLSNQHTNFVVTLSWQVIEAAFLS